MHQKLRGVCLTGGMKMPQASPPSFRRAKRGAAAHRLGLWAEALCRLALRLKMYRVLACRYKTPQGEIDIVALKGQTLVFVEVKARPSLELAGEAVAFHQQKRLAHAASAFLARHPHFGNHTQRFDAMWVLPWRWPVHIENAFEMN